MPPAAQAMDQQAPFDSSILAAETQELQQLRAMTDHLLARTPRPQPVAGSALGSDRQDVGHTAGPLAALQAGGLRALARRFMSQPKEDAQVSKKDVEKVSKNVQAATAKGIKDAEKGAAQGVKDVEKGEKAAREATAKGLKDAKKDAARGLKDAEKGAAKGAKDAEKGFKDAEKGAAKMFKDVEKGDHQKAIADGVVVGLAVLGCLLVVAVQNRRWWLWPWRWQVEFALLLLLDGYLTWRIASAWSSRIMLLAAVAVALPLVALMVNLFYAMGQEGGVFEMVGTTIGRSLPFVLVGGSSFGFLWYKGAIQPLCIPLAIDIFISIVVIEGVYLLLTHILSSMKKKVKERRRAAKATGRAGAGGENNPFETQPEATQGPSGDQQATLQASPFLTAYKDEKQRPQTQRLGTQRLDANAPEAIA